MPRATEPALATSGWEARCRSHGLALTAPRRAILAALQRATAPLDAVALLQDARTCHAGTSLGTTYRFLRELERHGWVRTHAEPHGRMRWQLADPPAGEAGTLRPLLDQLRHVLRQLEHLASRVDPRLS